MKTQDIETFLALCKYQSISRAAEKLFTTQPGVSKQLSALEKEFNTTFFTRGKGLHQLTLTEAGNVFLDFALKWDSLYLQCKNKLSSPQNLHYHFGCVRSFSDKVFETIFHYFSTLSPNTILTLVGRDSATLRDYVLDGTLNTALVCSVTPDPNLKIVPFAAEPMVFVCREDSPYNKENLSIHDLDLNKEILIYWCSEFKTWHNSVFGSYPSSIVHLNMPGSLDNFFFDPSVWCIMPISAYITLENNYRAVPLNISLPQRYFYLITHVSSLPVLNAMTYEILWEMFHEIEGIQLLVPQNYNLY